MKRSAGHVKLPTLLTNPMQQLYPVLTRQSQADVGLSSTDDYGG